MVRVVVQPVCQPLVLHPLPCLGPPWLHPNLVLGLSVEAARRTRAMMVMARAKAKVDKLLCSYVWHAGRLELHVCTPMVDATQLHVLLHAEVVTFLTLFLHTPCPLIAELYVCICMSLHLVICSCRKPVCKYVFWHCWLPCCIADWLSKHTTITKASPQVCMHVILQGASQLARTLEEGT